MDLPAAKRHKRNDLESKKNPNPSKVVHVRSLTEHTTENDIRTALSYFGNIAHLMVFPNRNQALVEYDDLDSSMKCVEYGKSSQIAIGNSMAYVNFSTSDRINRFDNRGGGGGGGGGMEARENRVLLFTILNCQYEITTDTMNTICSQCGNVLRIVMIRRNGVQAMVEFDNVEAAKQAKGMLNGADIYSGCCTLKIDFAKPETLTVQKNDSDTYDYTRPDLGPFNPDQGFGYGKPPALLGNAPPTAKKLNTGGGGFFGGGGSPAGDFTQQMGAVMANMGMGQGLGGYGGPQGQGQGNVPPYRGAIERFVQNYSPSMSNYAPPDNTVVMVYGLQMDRVNCNSVFNILCLYGNIMKVKFLKSKEGCCMVQVNDHLAAERMMANLSAVTLFDSQLQISLSKQKFLNDVAQPYTLKDGSPSFKDFSANRNNRYSSPEMAAKNRVLPPSEVLHYWNAPPTISEEELLELLKQQGTAMPKRIKKFPIKEGQRSSSGLLEFNSRSEGVETICLANHSQIDVAGARFPFFIKLSFSNQNQLGMNTSGVEDMV